MTISDEKLTEMLAHYSPPYEGRYAIMDPDTIRALIEEVQASRATPAGVEPAELSGDTGQLIDRMAEAIRGDVVYDDTPWKALSENCKIGWRGDAERALAVVKEYLTASRVSYPPPKAVTVSEERALRDEIERRRQNSVDTWAAMTAMRNSINEVIPLPSIDSDLLQGPEDSVFCATVADAVVSHTCSKAKLVEAQQAEIAELRHIAQSHKKHRWEQRREIDNLNMALAFVYRWAWEKEGNGTSDAERLDVIKHYPMIAALKETKDA